MTPTEKTRLALQAIFGRPIVIIVTIANVFSILPLLYYVEMSSSLSSQWSVMMAVMFITAIKTRRVVAEEKNV